MSPELDEKLVKAFPKLYADRNTSMRFTCMGWGFECSDGWFQLIWDLSAKLEELINKTEEETPKSAGNYKASQVKEKFGTLRFYMTMQTEDMEKAIDEAEAKSITVCDICGKEGKPRNKTGWLASRCPEHQ